MSKDYIKELEARVEELQKRLGDAETDLEIWAPKWTYAKMPVKDSFSFTIEYVFASAVRTYGMIKQEKMGNGAIMHKAIVDCDLRSPDTYGEVSFSEVESAKRHVEQVVRGLMLPH
jgi:hypothetical protein